MSDNRIKFSKKQLIEEFKHTRKISKSYLEYYTEYAKAHTKVYTEDDINNITIPNISKKLTVYSVHFDTVSFILNLGFCCKDTAVLNFADGLEPGGGVLQGAGTQEECLCRCSNLYESLILPECKEKYYKYNNTNYNDGKCSDRIIYTSSVALIKDAQLVELDFNFLEHIFDIITCPAPYFGSATDDEILQRMKGIIKVAYDNGKTELVLGAWGCGAFGNKLDRFISIWQKAIEELPLMSTIYFPFIAQEDCEKYKYLYKWSHDKFWDF